MIAFLWCLMLMCYAVVTWWLIYLFLTLARVMTENANEKKRG